MQLSSFTIINGCSDEYTQVLTDDGNSDVDAAVGAYYNQLVVPAILMLVLSIVACGMTCMGMCCFACCAMGRKASDEAGKAAESLGNPDIAGDLSRAAANAEQQVRSGPKIN